MAQHMEEERHYKHSLLVAIAARSTTESVLFLAHYSREDRSTSTLQRYQQNSFGTEDRTGLSVIDEPQETTTTTLQTTFQK
jgi:hypothetical protein